MDSFDAPMDLELDWTEDDKIAKFLLNQLELLRAQNDKLEKTLSTRRQMLRELAESDVETGENSVSIKSEPWKKIFNGKYVFGVTLENTGTRCTDLNVVLRWNSPKSLYYQVFIYEDGIAPQRGNVTSPKFICEIGKNCDDSITAALKKSNKMDKLGHLIVVLPQPSFIDELSLTFEGNVTFKQGDVNAELAIPKFEISACDSTNHCLHNHSLPNGDYRELMMVISASECTKLVLILPDDWLNSFDSTFEILCSLTKINTPACCRKLFVAHKLSPSFDDSLLVIHAPAEAGSRVYDVSVYNRTTDSFFSFLHHLYQNIPGVLLIPETKYESYVLDHPENICLDRETSEFKECFAKEIDFVKGFLGDPEQAENASKRDELIDKFSDLQRETNLHYLRVLSATDSVADKDV